ncbi:MAG: HNH endonuclease [Acidobacteria bacterium]|nr:HNH endonuclease [Acidobacteriota bacterium]
MVLPQACCYCGSRECLSVDHLIPTKRGGANSGDNMVWACRSCNSSKCARDALEWLAERNEFPPVLLLRRYLQSRN